VKKKTSIVILAYFRFVNMSWIVEQSENTSAVNVNGDTITCTSDSGYGSPINVLYKDPADKNGQYYWQIDFKEIQTPGGGGVSVGLTTDQGFQSGWGLKAMKYLGNECDFLHHMLLYNFI
jgi:hypothetical protein